jgi:hypothetical protein
MGEIKGGNEKKIIKKTLILPQVTLVFTRDSKPLFKPFYAVQRRVNPAMSLVD